MSYEQFFKLIIIFHFFEKSVREKYELQFQKYIFCNLKSKACLFQYGKFYCSIFKIEGEIHIWIKLIIHFQGKLSYSQLPSRYHFSLISYQCKLYFSSYRLYLISYLLIYKELIKCFVKTSDFSLDSTITGH